MAALLAEDVTAAVSGRAPFAGNLGWAVGGNLAYVASQFFVMVVVARLLGPTDVGTFSLALSIVAPVLVLTQLQLRIVLATDVGYRHAFADFVRIRVWTTIAMIAGVLLVAILAGYPREAVQVIVLLGIAKGFDAICDVLYGYHQRREDMRVVAVGQVINGASSLLLAWIAIAVTRDLVMGMIFFAIGSALTLFGWVIPATASIRRKDADDPRNQPRAQLALVRRAAPLAVVLFLSSLSVSIPRLFVEHRMGTFELGIFAGASYLVIAGANLINALGNAISPRLARLYASRNATGFLHFAGVSALLAAAGAFLGTLVSVAGGGRLLALIYTPDYRPYGWLLATLFASAIFGYAASFAVGAATAAQRFAEQIPVFVAVVLVGLVACALLVPLWGLYGAAAATGIMGAVQLFGCGLVVKRAVKVIEHV